MIPKVTFDRIGLTKSAEIEVQKFRVSRDTELGIRLISMSTSGLFNGPNRRDSSGSRNLSEGAQ